MLIDSIISKRVYVLVETIGEPYSPLVKGASTEDEDNECGKNLSLES